MIATESKTHVLINTPQSMPIGGADLDEILNLANGLPRGDVFVAQLPGSRGAFPPIERPAVTSIQVGTENIDLISRSRGGQAPPPVLGNLGHSQYPRSAIITAIFTAPPRIIDDMNRLVGAKASALLGDGGSVVLYDIETDKLLPRPREVIVLPATPERRATLHDFIDHAAPKELREAVGFHVEVSDTPTELLVAFDRESLDTYLKDAFDAPALIGNRWTLRVDPKRAVPLLGRVADNPGLRYLTPHLYRNARDLNSWIENLGDAHSIEAADSISVDSEELRVRIASK